MKRDRNYPLLLAAQFLSAFGDNAILAVILGQLTLLKKQGLISEELLRERAAIYTTLLFFPYILLAPLAGYLNDRYAKTSWLTGGNLIKLLGTAVCASSIWLGYIWQAPGYFIVGIGSCLYGPAKYGILPEILPRESLVRANGTVELLTLLAIITGGVAGAAMVDKLSVQVCYIGLAAIFGASLLLNLLMKRTTHRPEVVLSESVGEFFRHFKALLTAARLGRILVGTALFWVCGATMKINFQPWGLHALKLETNLEVSLLGLWLSVGVMAGSVLAGRLYKVGELQHTRRFGFCLAAMLALLWTVELFPFWTQFKLAVGDKTLLVWVISLLIATGFFAGLFLIPLNASLQDESPPDKLGKTIAVQNFLDNIGMVLAGALVLTCTKLGTTASQVFLVLAAAVALIVFGLRIPERRTA